jgi:rhodanese-related sulfurtransferase
VEFLQKNFMLVAVALASGLMLIWPYLRRGAGGPWINTLQATQSINREDALVLDVRDAAEFAQSHLLGARNIPLMHLDSRVSELDAYRDKPIIVVCGEGAKASIQASKLLRGKGFSHVQSLTGGVAAWKQAGLPVTK